jgi:hypothetical protein
MARKPNYSFERNARAKAKADKKEAKRQAKEAARKVKLAEDGEEPGIGDDPIPEGSAVESTEELSSEDDENS